MKLLSNDELFVLADKNPKEKINAHAGESSSQGQKSRMKNEEKKMQKENLKKLQELHKCLQRLFSSAKELKTNLVHQNDFISKDLAQKLQSDLDTK